MTAERRRDMLLDVALDVVVVEGFHAATIERVAREAGVTRTLLYSQFTDLAGMVSALVDRETGIAMQGLLEALAPMPEEMDLVDVSEALLRAMVRAVGRAPRSWHILLNPPEGGPPELHERIAAGRSMARAHVQRLLTGRLPAQLADPELTAHLHHLVGEELVRLHLRDPETFPVERLVRQVRQVAAGTLTAQRKERAR
jgi:AcrR family transcriptional regulator